MFAKIVIANGFGEAKGSVNIHEVDAKLCSSM